MNKRTHLPCSRKAHTMRTQKNVLAFIKHLESTYGHLLTGHHALIQINAPKALMQLETEAKLKVAYWVIGKEYKSKLKRP